MSQQEYFGNDSIQNLAGIIAKEKPESIFLVTGMDSYAISGAEGAINSMLSNYPGNVGRFYQFETNPKLEDAERGLEIFMEDSYDMVIAVGGGSVIDMAKLINIFGAHHNGEPMHYATNAIPITNKGKTFVAIPTTSGSGSEATRFAVVYIDELKYSVAHDFLLPDYAIIDPMLTITLPSLETAYSGLDAFSQAVESFWSVNSTEESRMYSSEAISLVMRNLVCAVQNPTIIPSRYAMSKAANLSGKAINIAKTTAPHAISYTLTSVFGVPHGNSVMMTLGRIFRFNSEVDEESVVDPRGHQYVKEIMGKLNEMLGVSSSYDAEQRIDQLMEVVGLETRLSQLGITEGDINLIARTVNLERLNNNPRKILDKDLRKILRDVL